MKVLLINGSPNEKGCTYRALREVADTLEKSGIETEIVSIGKKAIGGCIGCGVGYENKLCWHYGGPASEDRPHEYELALYALSEAVDLADGYYYNEFRRAIEGKVLAVAELKGVYPNS